MSEVTRKLRIHGEVQGVFYRAWSVETARSLGLRGWVRNRRDGSVEMVVRGEDETVRQFVERCREGPPAARVDRIDIEDATEEVPAGFEKRPSA